MKVRYIILLIVSFLVVIVYLWNEQKEALELLDRTYGTQLHREIGFITTFMTNSLPNTFDLYNNNSTENELSLFKTSLESVAVALNTRRVELEKIEFFYVKNRNLSESVEDFYNLMYEISDNAEDIDEDVFYQMSDMIYEYSSELSVINYRSTSLQNLFDHSSNLFNEMNQKIKDLMKLDDY